MHTTPQPAAPGLLSFADLLQESVEQHAARTQLKTARTKLASQPMHPEERGEIQAKIREWEAVSEWRCVAAVAMLLQQTCACGSTHTHFAGFFQRQSHRTSKIDRWVKEEVPVHLNLPRETKTTQEAVKLCITCASRWVVA